VQNKAVTGGPEAEIAVDRFVIEAQRGEKEHERCDERGDPQGVCGEHPTCEEPWHGVKAFDHAVAGAHRRQIAPDDGGAEAAGIAVQRWFCVLLHDNFPLVSIRAMAAKHWSFDRLVRNFSKNRKRWL